METDVRVPFLRLPVLRGINGLQPPEPLMKPIRELLTVGNSNYLA